jgi:hypothetical protein
MSVAWSSTPPSSARIITPASVWIALRVDAPRAAMPSAESSCSLPIDSFIGPNYLN